MIREDLLWAEEDLFDDIEDSAKRLRATIWNVVKGKRHAYVGATNSPEGRWAEEHEGKWSEMVLIAEASDFDEVVALESLLIQAAKARNESERRKFFTNDGDGGEGLVPGTGPWVIYVCWR